MRAPIPTGSRDVSVLRLSCYASVLRFRATLSCYASVLRFRATLSCYVFVLRLRATSSCYAFLLLRVLMPILPHFRDLAVVRLAEPPHARLDPRAGAAAAAAGGEFRC